MKITAEGTKNCEVVLTIEAESSEMNESLNEAYQHLVQQVSIPGFRKGKAPRTILEWHVGKKTLLERALEQLIPRLYKQAIELEKLEPVDEAKMEIVQTEPLVFKSVVPLKPEVKLGDYHNAKIDFKPIEINEEEVQAALQQIRQEQAVWIPVERPIRFGDLVTIDIEATMEGKPFLNHRDMLYEVNEGSNSPLPEVAQNLVGAEKSKVRTFTIDVPADYPVKEFAGKSYFFRVTPSEIKEKELPKLDDGLAQSAGYDNLAAMKEKVTAALKAKVEERNSLELREKVLDAVVELSEVHYPTILVEREIEGLIGDEARRLGFKGIKDYLEVANKTKEEYQEKFRSTAIERIIRSLVLDKIAEQENVVISDKEVDNKIEKMLESAEDKEKTRQFFTLPQIKKSIEQSLRNERALDRLAQIVTGNVGQETKEA